MKSDFTLDDFRRQLAQARQMDPGILAELTEQGTIQEREDMQAQLDKLDGLIAAMTADERRDPAKIGIVRRWQIARQAARNCPRYVDSSLDFFICRT